MNTPANKRLAPKGAKAKDLDARVRAFTRERGVEFGRMRQWIAYMALGGALDRRNKDVANSFVIKGGVALELRLRERARATRDFDVILNRSNDELLQFFESALSDPYEGFSFRRKGEPYVMRNGAVRLDVALAYYDAPWTTVRIDLSSTEGRGTEIELVDALPVAALGLTAPDQLPCLSLRYHIAQKIHGVTHPPRDGQPNERFRDLVDILLLLPLISNEEELAQACMDVFSVRASHVWPPVGTLPESWREPYRALAAEVGLVPTDFHAAQEQLMSLVARLNSIAT